MNLADESRVPVPDVPEELRPAASFLFTGRADDYASLLLNEGTVWGLLGPREGPRLWERHLLNCGALASLVPSDSFVADIGSGAGLPGIPLALVREDLRVDLVEPMARRCDFLSLCVDRLALSPRVRVVRSRAEEYFESVDIVTCRAVSSLASLLPMVSHLVPPAQLLAIKGERALAEVDLAQPLLRGRLTASVEHAGVLGRSYASVVRVASL